MRKTTRWMGGLEALLTLVGATLGWFGLPTTSRVDVHWYWMAPNGFRLTSVLELATVGLLIGLFIDILTRYIKGTARERWVWCVGIAIVCIICSVVSTYRRNLVDQQLLWAGGPGAGIIHLDILFHRYGDNAGLYETEPQVAVSLLQEAGTALTIGDDYFGKRGIVNLGYVAFGLVHAADDLQNPHSPSYARAKEFAIMACEVTDKWIHTTGRYDIPTVQGIISDIYAEEPSDYTQPYPW